ncbi:MAG: hypothetical protein M5R36_20105 [Deltaproteobacteria bacterium]|nr:hypothetical protein [Deltaproteobacteria bacterium]
MNIKIRPLLPPIVLISPVGAPITAPLVPVEFQLGDMIVNMFVDDGTNETLFLQMAVTLKQQAGMGIKFPDNTFELTLGDTFVHIYVFAEPLMDWDNSLFEDVAPLLVDLIMPVVSDLLGSIQLPTFDDFGYTVWENRAMGPSLDYVGIFMDLNPPPPGP